MSSLFSVEEVDKDHMFNIRVETTSGVKQYKDVREYKFKSYGVSLYGSQSQLMLWFKKVGGEEYLYNIDKIIDIKIWVTKKEDSVDGGKKISAEDSGDKGTRRRNTKTSGKKSEVDKHDVEGGSGEV